jgi:hypothetical protein
LCIGAILALLLSLERNSLLAALGVLYAGLPAVSLIWVRSDDPFGLRAVIFLILIVAVADTAAFLSGRLFRGPLLWPRVSPKKTWSGLLGALVASAVVGALFWVVVPDGSPLRLAATGAVLAAVAQAGDLAESALKRRFGAKDTGALLGSTSDSSGSWYLDLTATVPVTKEFSVVGHFGMLEVNKYSELDYKDWKLGVTYDLNGWVLGAAYVDTDADGGWYYTTGSKGPKENAKSTVVLSVTKTF